MATQSKRTAERAGEAEPTANQTIIVPPDGGWGWVIVGCGFLGAILTDGVSLAFPILEPNLIALLKESPVSISLILSIFNCLMHLMGPITSSLANRFGFRFLMFVGSFMYCLGFGLSFIINSYELLILCFSIIAGLGCSLIYMVLMACPGYWFEEKRSIAFGIVSAASGFTCIVMPMGSAYVEKTFGWRYVYFILAGLGFLSWLSSFLIKKPPVAIVEITSSDFKSEPELRLERKVPMTMSLATIGPQSRVDRKLKQISTHTGIQIQQKFIPRPSDSDVFKPKGFKKFWLKLTGQFNKTYVDRPMYKKDIFYQSTTSIIIKKYNMHPGEYTLSVQRMTTMKDMNQQLKAICTCCPEAIGRPLKEMLDVSMLKNPTFILIGIDTFLYYFSAYIPYVYVTKFCEMKGIGKATGMLAISLYGIGVSFSRLCFGLVFIVLPRFSPTYFSTGSVIVSGVLILGLTFTVNKVAVLILITLAGICFGPWLPLRSVLLVQYLGLEKLTSAMGLLFVIQAMGCLIGIPFTEFFITYFNEINANFYITGIVWILVGIILAPLDFVSSKTPDQLEESGLYRK